LKADVSELKSDVSVMKTDVTELKTDVTVLKADVTELKTDVSVMKTDVTELKTDVSVLKTDVSELKSDVSNMNQRMLKVEIIQENEIVPTVKAILEVVQVLQSGNMKFDRLNTKVQEHDDRIWALEQVVKANQD
jgi:chromosome segregation ATPase